jgi:putative transcriptional regulator
VNVNDNGNDIMRAFAEEWKDVDIEAVARAIEEDAGEIVPGIREALTEAKAGRFARAHSPAQILARSARAKTGLTQQAFADRIKTPVATLRDWEQGRFEPPGGVLCLLDLIDRHPDLAAEL